MTMTAPSPVSASDAEKAVRATSKRIRDASGKADIVRARRDAAVVSLHVHEDWPPVRCYRLIGVSRGLFVRMMDRAEQHAEKTGKPIPRVEDAEKVAKAATRDLARYEAVLTESRDKRDDLTEKMLNGRIRKDDGSVYRNAELARLTGLTTARVAQVRHGTR